MQKIIILCFVVLLVGGCNQNKETTAVKSIADTIAKPAEPIVNPEVPAQKDLAKQITDFEKELYASQELNEDKAKKMVSLYELYHQNYFKDQTCADYLFKAGELTENINQPYRSIGFYTKCYEEYPAFKLSAECLFRMANLYDYKLSNYIKAKALYQEVQVKFSKSPWAKDAAAAIVLMGKSDQEMIKDFEKKNNVKK